MHFLAVIECDIYPLLQRVVSKRAQARSRLLETPEERPTPPVAAAVELIKSLLSMSADPAKPPLADSATALIRRFTADQISAAFAHLRRRNFVYHGSSKRRFCLTQDFQASLQVRSRSQIIMHACM